MIHTHAPYRRRPAGATAVRSRALDPRSTAASDRGTRVCRGLARLLPLVLVALTLTGCGYTTQELFPDQYRSVAVPIFENRTFYRGVERDLSEALVKELQQRTPYAVAPPAAADTVLQGSIVDIEQQLLARRQPGGVPEELEVLITVNFQWKNLRTGEIIRDRQGFQAVGRYVPTSPVGEPLPIALQTAVQRLAEDIVSTMRADW